MIQSLNLGLRLVLELAALVAVGYWGFTLGEDWLPRLLAGIGLPLLLAAAWAVFRVPDDGGAPVVAIGGQLRLLLEFAVFAIAVAALAQARQLPLAIGFAVLVLLNYGIDYQRTLDFALGRR